MSGADFRAPQPNARRRREKPLFANPRNAAAGSLRAVGMRRSPAPAAALLRFMPGAKPSRPPGATQFAGGGRLCPIRPAHQSAHRAGDRRRRLLAHYRKIEAQRATLGYDIDGVVYKVDDLSCREAARFRLPLAALGPGAQVPAEQATTVIEAIEIQVGRTGALTPVAKLAPVTGRRGGAERHLAQ